MRCQKGDLISWVSLSKGLRVLAIFEDGYGHKKNTCINYEFRDELYPNTMTMPITTKVTVLVPKEMM